MFCILVLLAFVTLGKAEFGWTNWTVPTATSAVSDTFEVPELEKMYLTPNKPSIIFLGDMEIYSENINFHMHGAPGLPGVKKMTVSWKDFYAAVVDLQEQVAQLKQRVKELEN